MFELGVALSIVIGLSLGFFGGGGSILTVPLLVYVFGLEPKEAIASSLLIVGIASISGAIQHWRKGNVRPRQGLVFGVAGIAGAYIGARASSFLDGGLLLLLFAAMMLLTATAMWRGRKSPANASATSDPRAESMRSQVKLALQGFTVGSFTGLIGAGGGFLIVPALALWAGLPMAAAVGTSLMIIVLNSASGFVGHLGEVNVDYALVAAVASAAIAGSFVGSWLATRVDPASLRRGFAGFVMAMGAFILVREGALVVATLAPALPTSWPQVVFAGVLLVVGVIAGRSSTRADEQHSELVFSEGAGI